MDRIVFVDIDGVVADLLSEWLYRYNKDYDDDLLPRDITEWGIEKFVKPACGKKIFEYIENPNIYDDVKPIPLALEGIYTIREKFRVVFATTSTAGAMGRKYKWLQDWGFLDLGWKSTRDYIEIGDKSLLNENHILIDDNIENLERFSGYGFLFDAPYNRISHLPRLYDWSSFVIRRTIEGW